MLGGADNQRGAFLPDAGSPDSTASQYAIDISGGTNVVGEYMAIGEPNYHRRRIVDTPLNRRRDARGRHGWVIYAGTLSTHLFRRLCSRVQ